MAAGSTRATQALEEASVRFVAHAYELGSDSARTYGEAVANALGIEAERLFKTLVFEVDGVPCVAIVPVDGRVSTKKLARSAGGKRAAMIDPDTAERLTGYVTGGISPFGQRRPMPFYVDETIAVHDSVYVSGGRRGLQIEIAPADLVSVTGGSPSDLLE